MAVLCLWSAAEQFCQQDLAERLPWICGITDAVVLNHCDGRQHFLRRKVRDQAAAVPALRPIYHLNGAVCTLRHPPVVDDVAVRSQQVVDVPPAVAGNARSATS